MKKNEQITHILLSTYDFSNYTTPSNFIKTLWNQYTSDFPNNQSINGAVFENLISYALAYEGIENIYYQSEVSFVPNAIFDLILYHPKQTYTLSLKTSLRERWKQADLESYALKQMLKAAKCYVITLSHSEVATRRNMFSNGKDFYNGLDGFILADTPEFDNLISELKQYDFRESDYFKLIRGEKRINTIDMLNQQFNIDDLN